MSIIKEATIDNQFNNQMDKIQQAIIKLEKMIPSFSAPGSKPLQSQVLMIETAAEDLERLSREFDKIRLAK